MAIKIYKVGNYDHTEEREQYRNLCEMLKQKFADTADEYLFVGNVSVEGSEVDALLLKKDAVVIVEFKNFGGNITARENGEWTTDTGAVIKGGIRRSPYFQMRKNKQAVFRFMQHALLHNQSNFAQVQGLVVFHRPSNITVEFSPQVSSWLHVCDETRFIEMIEDITCPQINLEPKDMHHLIEALYLSDNQLDADFAESILPSNSVATHIGVKAGELYEKIYRIILSGDSQPIAIVNKELFEILKKACLELTWGNKQVYGNIFSMVDFICRDRGLSASDTHAIQTMRYHCAHSANISREDFLYDMRALCVFISRTFQESIPAVLLAIIPSGNKPYIPYKIDEAYIRCVVKSWDDGLIYVSSEGNTNDLKVDYIHTRPGVDLSYIRSLLRPNMQLNLLDCRVDEQVVTPAIIIIEPDMLMDISSVARCFQEYGHHELSFFVNRLGDVANSQAILLGNLAGSILDDVVHKADNTSFDLDTTFRNNLRQNVLKYCACRGINMGSYRADMLSQTNIIEHIVDEQLAVLPGYEVDKAILEPSFVCEKLGLQGRVDLMTTDGKILVEQKSGKNFNLEKGTTMQGTNLSSEDHYVQALLYFGVLHYNFGIHVKDTHIAMLYSKYMNGLIDVNFYQKLFYDALALRNKIVSYEFFFAHGGFGDVLPFLKPDNLKTQPLKNEIFWSKYLYPQLNSKLAPLQQLSELERTYFCRMLTFVYKEQLLSCVGSSDHSSSAADIWNMPVAEKTEMGNIYTSLHIVERSKSRPTGGYDRIVLSVPNQGDDFLPNFRRGDMVSLYSYREGEEPDMRRSILYKGNLEDIRPDRIVILLNNGQQNPNIMGDDATLFAVEHANTNVGVSSGISSLHQFVCSAKERKDLLLGQRVPGCNIRRTLSRPYHPDFDEILLKIKQSEDYFLLVGPPGTGKTSHALRYMVEEALADPQADILLLSYTNRAVDEICRMLDGEDGNPAIPYLRMGRGLSCDEACAHHLMENAVAQCDTLGEMRQVISHCHVFVSTTATLLRNTFLFDIKHFSISIIDEASQILEPDIVGILSAYRQVDGVKHCCIDRFVLIGDYKQLPAVVQQSSDEAVVSESMLRAAGIVNCAQSLFERLYRWEEKNGRDSFIGTLRKQGRMHPDVAEFPSKMFYAKERLEPIPLQHQRAEEMYENITPRDTLDTFLLKRRMIFIASQFCESDASDKVNINEAKIVATLLVRIYGYQKNKFSPQRTVGVIVPYRNQIAMIRQEVEKTGIEALREVSIDTVERYQGSQRDIIIYSFTIQHYYQIDFLAANTFEEDGKYLIDRKLNVAITRARKQMIVTGNPKILASNVIFASLMNFIQSKGGWVDGLL